MVAITNNNLTIGAAGTTPSQLNQLDAGALKGLAEQFIPKREGIDPALLSFLYFSNMAAEASKPGATALGAAGAAAQQPVAYLMKERELERADDKSRASLGASLVTALKPKVQTVKSMGAGDALSYMSEADAKQYLINKGLPENASTFKRLVEQISTKDTNLIGSPLIISGKPAEINFSSRGGIIFDANISQIKGSEKTDYAVYKTKKLQEIAKTEKDYINKMTTFLPNLKTAMNVLLDPNVKTGGIEGALLPAKQFLKSIFGFKDEDLQDQEFLRSISFKLAPQMRPAGSGSTSDMEFKAYQQAILDLGNSKFANYINLYSLSKMTENSMKLTKLETELLTSPQNYSKAYINDQIEKADIGIFDKFKVFEKDEDGKMIDIYSKEEDDFGDSDFSLAFEDYWNSLPKGSVFRNSDAKGQKIVPDAGPYIVKGL